MKPKRKKELRRRTGLQSRKGLQAGSKSLESKARIKRSRRIKPKKRSPEETLRIYGTEERRDAVKAMPCVVPSCYRTPSENSHLVNGGMGRKADADTIVPMCAHHHRTGTNSFHNLGSVRAFDAMHGTDLWATAKRVAKELDGETR